MGISSPGDQRLVADLLEERHTIETDSTEFLHSRAQLLIFDFVEFERYYSDIEKAKKEAGGIYLPLMVLIPKGKAGSDRMWEMADDVVEIPVSRKNLLTRVRGLIKLYTFSKEAEQGRQKVKQQNQQLHLYYSAVQSTGAGITITDARQKDQPIIFANRGFVEMTGYDQEEILGKNCRFLQGDDRDQPGRQVVRNAIEKGNGCVTIFRNYRKDGTLFWNELKISPIRGLDGEVDYFVGVQNDVTNLVQSREELKATKEKWQRIVAQNPSMLQLSVNGVITFMNRAGANMHGFDNPEDLTGMSLLDLYPKEMHETLRKRIEQVEQGEPTRPLIYTTKDKTGRVRYLKIQSIPVTIRGKAATQTVGEDVTDLKESENDLRHLLKEKQILLQEVHHRVKNNLAVLNALLGMQMAILEDSAAKTILADTQMRIISIAKVHEHLYNQENLNEIGFEEYARELIQKIGEAVDSESARPKFTLQVDPVELNLDQSITCGLLLNELITNSIKYAYEPGEDVRIDIGIHTEGEMVSISYRDFGKGIDNVETFFKEGNFGATVMDIFLQQLKAEWNLFSDNGFHFDFTFRKAEYHGPSRNLHRADEGEA